MPLRNQNWPPISIILSRNVAIPRVSGVLRLNTYEKLEIGEVPNEERIINTTPKVKKYNPIMKTAYLIIQFFIFYFPFFIIVLFKSAFNTAKGAAFPDRLSKGA